ncbi:YHYH protein [Sagittula sp. SSi028]|uniref:YHYH protein n=1 Tax=Sagittula sp. SSi028 TaxID=3400636 RepID=UPI003AF80B88
MMPRSPFVAALLVCAAIPAHAHETDTAAQIDGLKTFFQDANTVSEPELVDCTLSSGTKTSCFSITLRPEPTTYTPGPWCPTHITDGADKGGIWIVDGTVEDVTGDFITRLAEIYGDSEWKLYDEETGEVRYTGTLEGCEAAARPDVDEAYNNYCVQCLPDYVPDDTVITYVIPLQPQMGETPTPTNMAGSGLAYNGVRLDGPAPLDAILSAHTIAAFDDCGGHVNTHVGYHYHAVTDCLNDAPATTTEVADQDRQIGIAMDGFPIMAHRADLVALLDSCNGLTDEDGHYRYYAGAPGSNAILGCHMGEVGCTLQTEGGVCDASAMDRRGPPPAARND